MQRSLGRENIILTGAFNELLYRAQANPLGRCFAQLAARDPSRRDVSRVARTLRAIGQRLELAASWPRRLVPALLHALSVGTCGRRADTAGADALLTAQRHPLRPRARARPWARAADAP
jgi:hypothetical protein